MLRLWLAIVEHTINEHSWSVSYTSALESPLHGGEGSVPVNCKIGKEPGGIKQVHKDPLSRVRGHGWPVSEVCRGEHEIGTQ